MHQYGLLLQPSVAQTIDGVLFTRAPTFPTGQINLQLNGVTFTRAPTFATGAINLQLTGVLFTRAGTFPSGAVNAQPVTLAGVLFTATVLFPTGSVTLISLTFWLDDKVAHTDNKVGFTKLQPSVPNPL